MKREYELFLNDIVEACEYIQEFVEEIDFEQFLKDEAYGLTSQMRRCAISIPSNIAEGYCRN